MWFDAQHASFYLLICCHRGVTTQGCNEVRWRPGQETSSAFPCSILSSFGSKCAVKESTCDIVGTFRRTRSHSAPGELRPPRHASAATLFVAGELPWDEPSVDCEEYCNWLEHKIQYSPWNKISTLPLALLRKILVREPDKRYTIPSIHQDRLVAAVKFCVPILSF